MPFPNEATQFKPGHDKPGPGRPPRRPITDALKRIMLEEHPRYPGMTRAEVIAKKWAERAEDEAKDCVPLTERVDGKPAEEQDVDVGAIVEQARDKAIERKKSRGKKGKEE